ncbi:MAG: DDE-type integrase/transposase/recombinase [Nanoarchaeota archaeon]|nr:DDE-type integrase/transposase/recombinase [Nanoarchaeota archaeon]MBU4352300.1 DDE-type integrase/transposase/recombinase [Nanoarchaeota archaeon]MCG2719635.1 DDE-type integrase/transposase/recombinase [Nanoarchaeota archaeon]
MKLTRSKILEILRMRNNGETAYQARKVANISVRRVYQIYSEYLIKGEPPAIGRRMGRPKRPITDMERMIVKKAYEKYRVSASTLEKLIKRDFGTHIPHNHIHKIMINLDYAKPKNKTDIRKKNWIRYERKHSLTAVHLDWYNDAKSRLWVLPVIDDASRKMLALVEEKDATTDNSIKAMKEALEHGKIKQCITDHGTQFIKGEDQKSRFHEFLKKNEIKHILCKIKHPQTNGKSEKFNDLYKNHRHAFATKEEFMHWYNEIRPHRSLNFAELETPQQAFIRKMKAEV